jgi:hypothetical protein
MGLYVAVGYLDEMKACDSEGYEWAQKEFEQLYRYLKTEGYSDWREPEQLPALGLRSHVSSFPYHTIHYLRRVYALWSRLDDKSDPQSTIVPMTESETIDDYDMLIEDETSILMSHLLCHSDTSGWYVPIDFSSPLFAPESFKIHGGGMVGSSHALLRELCRIAPALGIRLEDGILSDEEATRVYQECVSAHQPWSIEYTAWLALFEKARVSILFGTAIRFS